MELRQLRYFVTVARHGNFGRASRALNVAQPALSRQIQKLEEELGTRLFLRHAHGATLTQEASSLLERAENILANADAMVVGAKAQRNTRYKMVSIGLSPGTAELLTVPLSQKVAERFPSIRLRFFPALMPTRHELLLKGRIAFALMNAPPGLPGITLEPLMREPLCLICRADETRFDGPSIKLSDISDVPLVLGGIPESGVRGILNDAMADAGLTLNVIAEVNTAGASIPLVVAGVAPTVHVAVMARAAIERGELKVVPIEGLYSYRMLAFPAEAQITPDIAGLMDILRNCVQEMVAQGTWLGGELIAPANA